MASEFQLLLDFMHAKLVHNKFAVACCAAAADAVVVVPGDHGQPAVWTLSQMCCNVRMNHKVIFIQMPSKCLKCQGN